jgi:RNA methyltransferase, TrmH family
MKNSNDELLIYGRRAVRAVWEQRPHAIIRAYATKERVSWLGDMLKWCAEQRKAYHLVSEAELEKITHSVHNEGVALLIKAKPSLSESELFSLIKAKPASLLFLDGVSNPHNVGALIRTMTHFGSPVVIGQDGELPEISAAWVRISEGGSEVVEIHRCRDKRALLLALKNLGYKLFALSRHGKRGIYNTPLPERCVFLLGHEIHGLSKAVLALADETLCLPGTGVMSSLNVSAAGAICLSEWYRHNRLNTSSGTN